MSIGRQSQTSNRLRPVFATAKFGNGPLVSKKKLVAPPKKEKPEDIQTRRDAEDLVRQAQEVSSDKKWWQFWKK